MDNTIYIIGAFFGIGAAIYMLYFGLVKYSRHEPARRIVYILIGLLLLYHGIIYSLVIFHVLGGYEGMEPPEYSDYLRPLVSLFLFAPVAVDIVQRRWGRLK